jgi:hypothetical protein
MFYSNLYKGKSEFETHLNGYLKFISLAAKIVPVSYVPVIPDPTSPTTEDLLPATTEPVKALKTRKKW